MNWSRLARCQNPWRGSEPQKSGGDVAECNHSKNREKEVTELYQEEVSDEEKGLAEKLRSYCTHYGQEKRENLSHSADILLQLGRLYLQKAVGTKGILQKVSYIRCCALLNASRVRFKILKCKDKLQEVRNVCHDFSHSLLKSCQSSNNISLLEVSERFHKKIRQMRREVKELLNVRVKRAKSPSTPKCVLKLEMLANDASLSPSDVEKIVSEGQEKQANIIDAIKTLNNKITDYYKLIMKCISDECIQILGKVPCKFSIAGLGSLARGETTLYSDFEHVIILEESVDQRKEYSNILEYFRWFSVVFQAIIIGFGETILPSVVVKCLNDAYSGDPHKNWFYDTFTPRGMAFDGMLPHSCNIPLGRRHTTKRCQHVVELIQTPKNMANYLSYEEALKNGYYLDEVLRQTCLVWGDENTYNCFISERERRFRTKRCEIIDYFEKRIKANSNMYVRESDLSMDNLATFDCKGLFYRSLTVRLGLLARIYNIPSDSSFCIIQNLDKLSWFIPALLRNLNYGFAVACEMRLKLYSAKGRQTPEAGFEEIKGLVGEEAAFACKDSVRYLKYSAIHHVRMLHENHTKRLNEIALYYTTPSVKRWISEVSNRGFYKDFIRFYNKLQHYMKEDEKTDISYYLFVSYCKVGDMPGKNQGKFHRRAEEIFATHLRHAQFSDKLNLVKLNSMMNLYLNQSRGAEAMKMLEKFFEIYFASENRQELYGELVDGYMIYQKILVRDMIPRSARHPTQEMRWQNLPGIDCEFIRRCIACQVKCSGNICGIVIQKEVSSLVQDIKLQARNLQYPTDLLMNLVNIQVMQWWLLDAVKSIELIEQILIVYYSRVIEKVEASNLESLKLLCFFRSGNHKMSLRETAGESNEELHDLCLREFVSILWRNIIRSTKFYLRAGANVILFWLIHLTFVRKSRNLFCHCGRPGLIARSGTWAAIAQFSLRYLGSTTSVVAQFANIPFLLLAQSFKTSE